ncbi:MAG: F0F1 ATP synthase subunit C [Halobacteria archaeon]
MKPLHTALALLLLVAPAVVQAAETADAGASRGFTNLGLAVGAGLAIGLAGLGTGLAQANIGAAAVGAIAEDPKFFGKGLIMTVIPETIVLFGFVMAFLLFGKTA